MTNRVELTEKYDLSRNQDKFLLTETLGNLDRAIEANLAELDTIREGIDGGELRPASIVAFGVPGGATTVAIQTDPITLLDFLVDQFSSFQFGPVGATVRVEAEAADFVSAEVAFVAPALTGNSTGDYVARMNLPAQILVGTLFPGDGLREIEIEFVTAIPPGWREFSTVAIRIFFAASFPGYGDVFPPTATEFTVSLRVRNPVDDTILASTGLTIEVPLAAIPFNLQVPYQALEITAREIKASWRTGVPLKFELVFGIEAFRPVVGGTIDIGKLEVNWE